MPERLRYLPLAEAAESLGRSVPSLLEMARDGQLTLCVFISGARYDAAWGEQDPDPPWDWDPHRPVFGASELLSELPAGHYGLSTSALNDLLLHGGAECSRVHGVEETHRRTFGLEPTRRVSSDDVVIRAAEYERLGGSWAKEPAADGVHADAVKSGEARPSMKRVGPVWHLEWRGKQASLQNSKGLRVLAVLLQRPRQHFGAVELAVLAEGNTLEALPPQPTAKPVFDAKALARYKREVHRLRALEADAGTDGNQAGEFKARQEREELEEFLAKNLGLGGRTRQTNSPAEQERKNTSRAVKRAQDSLDALLPALADHLRTSVKLGLNPIYNPVGTVNWLVSLD